MGFPKVKRRWWILLGASFVAAGVLLVPIFKSDATMEIVITGDPIQFGHPSNGLRRVTMEIRNIPPDRMGTDRMLPMSLSAWEHRKHPVWIRKKFSGSGWGFRTEKEGKSLYLPFGPSAIPDITSGSDNATIKIDYPADTEPFRIVFTCTRNLPLAVRFNYWIADQWESISNGRFVYVQWPESVRVPYTVFSPQVGMDNSNDSR